MRTVLIESASTKGVLSLAEGKRIVSLRNCLLGVNRAIPLAPLLGEMLQENKWTIGDIDLLIVGIGPGSYTGIRIGVAFAKGLSYGKKIPLVGVTSLVGFVPQNPEEGSFLSIIDAKMGGVYLLEGKQELGNTWFSSPEVCSMQELQEKYPGPIRIVSPEIDPLKKKAQSLLFASSLTWEERFPDPAAMLCKGQEEWERGKGTIDGSLSLLYLQKTQAEREKENL